MSKLPHFNISKGTDTQSRVRGYEQITTFQSKEKITKKTSPLGGGHLHGPRNTNALEKPLYPNPSRLVRNGKTVVDRIIWPV